MSFVTTIREHIDGLRERLASVIEPQRARVSDALEGMSPRDRGLLYGLLIFFTVMVLVGATLAVRSNLNRLEESLATRRSQLAMVKEMATSYADGIEHMKELEETLDAHEDTTLSAFLEKAAERTQIRDNLKQVKERSATTLESVEEKKFVVTLSRVKLEQLVGFLYEVETSGYPSLVRSTQLKTVVVHGERVLDVTLEMSAFRLLEDE